MSTTSVCPVEADLRGPDYEDVLEDRRFGSDLRWAAQEWCSSGGYRRGRHVTHQQAVQHVLCSSQVVKAISKVTCTLFGRYCRYANKLYCKAIL